MYFVCMRKVHVPCPLGSSALTRFALGSRTKGGCTYCALDESRKRVEHMGLGGSRESTDKDRIISRECGCENNRGAGADDNTISCTHVPFGLEYPRPW